MIKKFKILCVSLSIILLLSLSACNEKLYANSLEDYMGILESRLNISDIENCSNDRLNLDGDFEWYIAAEYKTNYDYTSKSFENGVQFKYTSKDGTYNRIYQLYFMNDNKAYYLVDGEKTIPIQSTNSDFSKLQCTKFTIDYFYVGFEYVFIANGDFVLISGTNRLQNHNSNAPRALEFPDELYNLFKSVNV